MCAHMGVCVCVVSGALWKVSDCKASDGSESLLLLSKQDLSLASYLISTCSHRDCAYHALSASVLFCRLMVPCYPGLLWFGSVKRPLFIRGTQGHHTGLIRHHIFLSFCCDISSCREHFPLEGTQAGAPRSLGDEVKIPSLLCGSSAGGFGLAAFLLALPLLFHQWALNLSLLFLSSHTRLRQLVEAVAKLADMASSRGNPSHHLATLIQSIAAF